jgi:tRNA threonylcarbamoyladenosine biosynthesis protein TsaE
MHNNNDITLSSKISILVDEEATLSCGARFAKALESGLTIYLHGDLGAGKTTFVRGVLQGLGHVGKVKSPTYNLVEIYQLEAKNKLKVKYQYNLYHFDLYRFNSELEWDAAGFREYFNSQSICMIEWPEKAISVLPSADIDVYLVATKDNIDINKTNTRQISFKANSVLGKQCLESLYESISF